VKLCKLFPNQGFVTGSNARWWFSTPRDCLTELCGSAGKGLPRSHVSVKLTAIGESASKALVMVESLSKDSHGRSALYHCSESRCTVRTR
jgi:hypothetical protein